MKQIDRYIIEKLKLNKDSEIEPSKEELYFKDFIFYIQKNCKKYDLVFEQDGYWLYLYYKEKNRAPFLHLGYQVQTEGNKKTNAFTTISQNGTVKPDKITICISDTKIDTIDIPKDIIIDKNGGTNFVPNEWNIVILMKLLKEYAKEHSEIDEYIEPYHPDVIYSIDEKLKLDKDSHSEKEEYEYLTQMYNKNDLCLYIKNTGFQHQERILLDVVKVLGVSKTQVKFQFITNIGTPGNNAFIKMSPNQVKVGKLSFSLKYMSDSGNSAAVMLMPADDGLELLNKIRKNNNTMDFFAELWYGGRNKEDYVPVMQKIVAWPNGFRDYEKISDDNLNLLEKTLKNE